MRQGTHYRWMAGRGFIDRPIKLIESFQEFVWCIQQSAHLLITLPWVANDKSAAVCHIKIKQHVKCITPLPANTLITLTWLSHDLSEPVMSLQIKIRKLPNTDRNNLKIQLQREWLAVGRWSDQPELAQSVWSTLLECIDTPQFYQIMQHHFVEVLLICVA